MHSKLKGNIAFTAVVLELQKNGFNVFSELGDYSKIDLIVEKNSIIKTIQVKFSGENEDRVKLKLKKSGPNGYRYTYTEKDIDWFALYSPFNEKIVWVSSKKACENNCQINIRMLKPKNNQIEKVNLFEDFGIDKFISEF